MSTDKTLAGVQPGGRVRLGGQAERARFEAFLSGNPLIALCAGTAWEIWQAALSAQPSPGGQDALHEAARRVISDIDSGDYGGTISMATYDALVAALAARQPVGEPHGWLIERPDVSPFFVPASHPEIVECFRTELAAEVGTTVTEVFTTPQPPAQAVDLEQFRELLTTLVDRCGDDISPDQFMLAGRLLNLIDSQAAGK